MLLTIFLKVGGLGIEASGFRVVGMRGFRWPRPSVWLARL